MTAFRRHELAQAVYLAQLPLDLREYLNVDLFAGGGGASEAMEEATGECVDIAVNHDDDAVSMHIVNHPQTTHYREDIRRVEPRVATRGRPVGRLHASPECTHHSQARGGQPRSKESRALSWMVIKWVGQTLPLMLTMENVMQILQWGPLIAKRCAQTGRVITLDVVPHPITGKPMHRVAEPGERVPVQRQYLVPDPKRKGKTWARFLHLLRDLGYKHHYDKLVAADYGAATTRERLFFIARRDGVPLNWPEATHAKNPRHVQQPWVPQAAHIDWSLPCPSIFLDEEGGKAAGVRRPLAAKTMERLRKGVKKFVLDHPDPFIVSDTAHPTLAPFVTEHANASNQRNMPANEPGRTICSEVKGGHFAVVAPVLVGAGGPSYAGKPTSCEQPAGTILTENHRALGVAYLAQHNGGHNKTLGRHPEEPATALTTTGSQQNVVTANLVTLRNGCIGRDLRDGAPAITAGADDLALMECTLSPENEAGALRVAAFLMGYYGSDNTYDPRDPAATITTRDRLALVTVTIKGSPYVIVDIGMRMLTPRELYLIQGFPPDYKIDFGHDGRRFSNKAKVRMCGNSVSPKPYYALLKANPLFPEESMREAA
ncbi:cytosine methyltransferase [Pseudomonas nitroreducens]|uniref:DNA cytosine methyltransferase n=1 Tax=Pseudomonas TaxID=286 RepID=UPI0007EE4E45|nr:MULTISPECIES: DNA cytosine methyltransferase [Pseudomonas]NMZ72945.1 cytosine methyltransferase [Pseudomonas nitroreducens]OBY59436.1 cytosine methyltransferase [Pseudomonas sp. AU12215]